MGSGPSQICCRKIYIAEAFSLDYLPIWPEVGTTDQIIDCLNLYAHVCLWISGSLRYHLIKQEQCSFLIIKIILRWQECLVMLEKRKNDHHYSMKDLVATSCMLLFALSWSQHTTVLVTQKRKAESVLLIQKDWTAWGIGPGGYGVQNYRMKNRAFVNHWVQARVIKVKLCFRKSLKWWLLLSQGWRLLLGAFEDKVTDWDHKIITSYGVIPHVVMVSGSLQDPMQLGYEQRPSAAWWRDSMFIDSNTSLGTSYWKLFLLPSDIHRTC